MVCSEKTAEDKLTAIYKLNVIMILFMSKWQLDKHTHT